MDDFEGNEVTEEVTNDAVDIDYDSLNVDDDNDSGDQETPTRNPAWDPILELIPEQLHSRVIPHLSKTDKHVQSLQQTYAPFKQFIDNGVTADVINQGLSLGQAIANDPQSVYDALREKFDLTHDEAIKVLEDNEEDDDESQGYEYGDEEDGEDDDDLIDIDDAVSNHPLVRQLQEQAQRQNQRDQEIFREQQLNEIKQEVDKEWAEIEEKAGGKLSDSVRDDIMQRALYLAGDGVPKLKDGFNAHVKFVTSIRNSTANNSAPSVADGTGLLPGANKYDLDTADGRQQRMVDQMRKMGITEG